MIYAGILAALVLGFVLAFLMRSPMALNVLHDRNTFYRMVDKDTIENVYTIKIMNKGRKADVYQLSASGLPGLEVATDVDVSMLQAAPGELISVPIKIRASKAEANKRLHTIELHVSSESASVSETIKYFGYKK